MAERTYPLEIKKRLIQEVIHNHRTVTSVAKELGVPPPRAYYWVNKAREKERPKQVGQPTTRTLQETLKQVEKERDMLEKLVMYLAAKMLPTA